MKTCIAIRPPSADPCGKPATHIVTWTDGDKSAMCESCSLATQQLAQSHGSRISTSKLEAAPEGTRTDDRPAAEKPWMK